MKLWLAQRFGRAGNASSVMPGHLSGNAMSVGSLEHTVRIRVRTFLRHTWLVTILGTIILGAGVAAAIYLTTAPTVMRIAAGPADSANTKFVQVMMQKFAGDHDSIKPQLVATGGPKESAQAMVTGNADLAILPSTIGNSPDWPVVAILRQNVMALIIPAPATATAQKETSAPAKKEASATEKKEKSAKGGKSAKAGKSNKAGKSGKTAKAAKSEDADAADADAAGDKSSEDAGETAAAGDKLKKVQQLAGRRVGIVTGNVATKDLLDVVLNHYGVPLDKVQVSLIDPKNLAEAVKANQVDAIFVAGAATGQALTDAVAAASRNGAAPSFIAIDQAEGIAKRNPAFDSIDIDAGTFGGNPPSPDKDLKSLSFPEYLVARKSLSRDSIASLAKLIYASRLALAAAMPGEIKIEAPPTEKDAGVTVHPGALAYLTDDQKSFFDRYGDDIFYGLLIFPMFGSAVAAVASYFRHGGRTRRLRLLQRVLDLVRKAHAAPSLEALDQMQIDVDNLVVAVIHQGEHEEYDQTEQMSFSLAIDQVRFAIAARRAVLLEQVGTDSKAGAKAAAA
jgi:TRAP-type uncharacterized transport system substrate-binding protein